MSFLNSASSRTTQVDSRQIVGPGGVLISTDNQTGNLLVDFRDDAATAAASQIANQSIVSTQDIGLLALQIAEQSGNQGEILRLAVIGGFTLATIYLLMQRKAI